MTLAGLRSRCSTPRSCAAASPAQICRAISMRPLLGEAADALQQRGEILAVDVLHRQEHAAVGPRRCRRRGRRSVRHLPRDAHFVVEPREPLRILGHRRRQELQRDGLPEAEILGAVDLAHAAAAEQAEDAVALGQQRARRDPLARWPGAGRRQPAGTRRRARGWLRRVRAAARLQPGFGERGFVAR